MYDDGGLHLWGVGGGGGLHQRGGGRVSWTIFRLKLNAYIGPRPRSSVEAVGPRPIRHFLTFAIILRILP